MVEDDFFSLHSPFIEKSITRAISLPRLSDLLRNSTVHFRMFLYLVTRFIRSSNGFVAMPDTGSNNFVSLH